jgi:hypothetical protein
LIDENGNVEFEGKKYKLITNLVIPEGIKKISNYQFYNFNQIDEIKIPKSLEIIEKHSFSSIDKDIRIINKSSIKK